MNERKCEKWRETEPGNLRKTQKREIKEENGMRIYKLHREIESVFLLKIFFF